MRALKSFAKPYARALFSMAKAQGDLSVWIPRLEVLKQLLSDVRLAKTLSKKRPAEAVKWVQSLSKDALDPQTLTLLYLLLENKRLNIVSEIKDIYEGFLLEAQGFGVLYVKTAVALSSSEQETALKFMEKKFEHKLKPHYVVDPSIRGGIVGRVGDLVYDGSVKGSLEKLSEFLAP